VNCENKHVYQYFFTTLTGKMTQTYKHPAIDLFELVEEDGKREGKVCHAKWGE